MGCVRNDGICAIWSTSLGWVNVCRCFTRPVVPRILRRWETGYGTVKLGRCIAVVTVYRRTIYNGLFGFFEFGVIRSVGNIATSPIIKVLGVLLTRTSQRRFEKASAHLLHMNLHYLQRIWNRPSTNWIRTWDMAVAALFVDGCRCGRVIGNE